MKADGGSKRSGPGGPGSAHMDMAEAVRGKVQAALTSALSKAADEQMASQGSTQAVAVAREVEEALYARHGSVGKEYRMQYRSILFNLKVGGDAPTTPQAAPSQAKGASCTWRALGNMCSNLPLTSSAKDKPRVSVAPGKPSATCAASTPGHYV